VDKQIAMIIMHRFTYVPSFCRGSYDVFRRYLRKRCPAFHGKVLRMRIETPPGALAFVDWKEDVPVQMGGWGRWVKVQALCMSLGFSRKPVVRFCEKRDLASFIHGHQEGFRALGGLPEMVRLSEEAICDTGVYLSDRVRGWAVEVARRQVALYHDIVARQSL